MARSSITSIFWDLDGTLLRTSGRGWPCILKAAGLDSTTLSPSSFSGLSDYQILDQLLGQEGAATEEILDVYLECLHTTLQPGFVEPIPQASAALQRLILEGEQNCIVTGNHRDGAKAKLHSAGFSDTVYNLRIYGSSFDLRTRFSIAAEAIQELGVDRAIFVGDSLNDVETARWHGSACIAVATGHHSANELKQAGADLTLAPNYHWADLVEAIRFLQIR